MSDSNLRPPAIRRLQAKAGATLDASEVFGRDKAIARAIKSLERGENLLLDEPRRFGKTSFAELLVESLPNGWSGRKVSLQGLQTTTEVAVSLLGALRIAVGQKRSLNEIVGRYLKQVDIGPFQLAVGFESSPLPALEHAVKSISDSALKDGMRVVLVVDELTEVVREIGRIGGPEGARALLGTMRRLREECRGVLWVLTGSIGFHHVLSEIGATNQSINNTKTFTLGPLDQQWAAWLAGCLLLDAGFEQESEHAKAIRDEVARATDGIAMLVHMIGEHVRDEEIETLNVIDIENLMDECFRRNDRSANLTHLLSRIEDYYGDQSDAAKQLLNSASAGPLKPTELQDNQEQQTLIETLIADHYLERTTDGSIQWMYPSLRRLWRIRQGLTSTNTA
jgi:hypothetical protein